MSESADELLERIESLERLVSSLRGQGEDFIARPYRPVFLARTTGEDDGEDTPSTGFVEQTVNNGEIADFDDGRKSLTDGDASNLIEPDAETFAVIEVEDVDGAGEVVMRYVPIRSGADRFTVLRVDTNQTPTLAAGYYWAYVQERNDTPFDPFGADLVMGTFYDDASATRVILVNTLDQGLTSHTISHLGGPFYACDSLREQVESGGTNYDLYMTFAVVAGC